METVLSPVSEDDEAMRRVAGGDGSALAELFDRHKSRLFAIARNLALGELRHRSVVARAQVRLIDTVGADEDGWDARRREVSERVRDALSQLPEEQRSALILKEYQQMEYREIGQVLGCSEAAARARTYRARVALREALRDWWEAEP